MPTEELNLEEQCESNTLYGVNTAVSRHDRSFNLRNGQCQDKKVLEEEIGSTKKAR